MLSWPYLHLTSDRQVHEIKLECTLPKKFYLIIINIDTIVRTNKTYLFLCKMRLSVNSPNTASQFRKSEPIQKLFYTDVFRDLIRGIARIWLN